VTRDGGIPLTWHAHPGDKPDVTQFTGMIDQLVARYQAVTAAAGAPAAAPDVTVVFDAGQNSTDNFRHLAGTGLHWIGSVPASDCPDLIALPASVRAVVDKDRFGGLTAYDTRRAVYGAERRAILTHSPELHDAQAAGFTGTTLAKAVKKLHELAATLARGKTRRPREKVAAEIETITRQPWVRRVIRWQLTGDQPRACAWPGRPTRRPARSWRRRSSASTCWSPVTTTGLSPTSSPGTGPSPKPSSPSASSKTGPWSRSRLCTTGPTTTSGSTFSPASWPSSSPISCATAPASTSCAYPSASCSPSSQGSRKPS